MRRFIDRVVVVTGAASGLGAETARQFAAEGARLLLVDLDETRLNRTAERLRADGAEAEVVAGDVAEARTAESAVAAATRAFGRIDILFNNAGIDPLDATDALATTEAQWDAVMAVNVKSAWLFCKAALPVMIAAGGGAIVNTASVAGLGPSREETAYCVSKAALVQLTKCVALDYARHGVRSNCICPGFLESVMSDRRADMSSAMLRERSERAGRVVPLGREGRYEETARAVLFLSSAWDAAYVTGATLVIDGGITLT